MNEWINVKTAIPNELESVLVFSEIGIHQANYFDGDWKLPDGDWIVGRRVSHWMPLPKPPKRN